MTAPTPPAAGYALDNQHPEAPTHHSALAAMLDPFTTAHIPTLLDLAGARCWEVGAGGGSIACWLARQIGDEGKVLATDTQPDLIPDHPRLRTRVHDLTRDPLPDGQWNLIHARLVLMHLPGRRQILNHLISRLAPGGVILIEDWTPRLDTVMAAPTREAHQLYTTFREALTNQVFTASGVDHTWGRHIHQALLDEGLSGVRTRIHAQAWPGGTPGCRLMQALITQVRPNLLAAGLSDEHLNQVDALLNDPRLVLHGHPMYSTSATTLNGGSR